MGHPQGPTSLPEKFVQPSPSVPPQGLSQQFRTKCDAYKQGLLQCKGEGDIQRLQHPNPWITLRQQFRAKLDAYKQRFLQLQEIINAKARAT